MRTARAGARPGRNNARGRSSPTRNGRRRARERPARAGAAFALRAAACAGQNTPSSPASSNSEASPVNATGSLRATTQASPFAARAKGARAVRLHVPMVNHLQRLQIQPVTDGFLILGMNVVEFAAVDQHGEAGVSHIAEHPLLRLAHRRPVFDSLPRPWPCTSEAARIKTGALRPQTDRARTTISDVSSAR